MSFNGADLIEGVIAPLEAKTARADCWRTSDQTVMSRGAVVLLAAPSPLPPNTSISAVREIPKSRDDNPVRD